MPIETRVLSPNETLAFEASSFGEGEMNTG